MKTISQNNKEIKDAAVSIATSLTQIIFKEVTNSIKLVLRRGLRKQIRGFMKIK